MLRRPHSLPEDPQQRTALAQDMARAIGAGGMVVLPTETVYGLAVLPDDRQQLERASEVAGRDRQLDMALHLADEVQAHELGRLEDARLTRLLRRFWPGPLTVVVPRRDDPEGQIGLRLPAHEFTRDVIRMVGRPVYMIALRGPEGAPLADPAEILQRYGESLDALVDDGFSPLGNASTVIGLDGDALVTIREGILSSTEILANAEPLVLFVCTGNTCRSPLAEALAHRLSAERGLAGFRFQSAGTAAAAGQPASAGSLEAAREIGLDLAEHRSQPITPELVRSAARVFALSGSHHAALLHLAPELADRITLLDPSGGDVPDPFGGNLDLYRRTRDALHDLVGQRLDEIAAGD
jgi:tRNA threonylcarbamoyl adenosine modification protein (Sua5/YciO/YrdC/YwlC family)